MFDFSSRRQKCVHLRELSFGRLLCGVQLVIRSLDRYQAIEASHREMQVILDLRNCIVLNRTVRVVQVIL